jgi:DNA primase
MPSLDFAAIRRAVPIARVLELLQFVPTERRGNQLRGPCPIHGSTSPNSRSFSVNLAKNAFRCFTCGASGNQLDLWSLATKLPLYEAAIDFCDRLQIPQPPHHTPRESAQSPKQRRGTRSLR